MGAGETEKRPVAAPWHQTFTNLRHYPKSVKAPHPAEANPQGEDLANNVGEYVDDPTPAYTELLSGEARLMGEPKPHVRRPSAFRQSDISRAIAAAQSRGLVVSRVEVDPVTAKITMMMKDDTVTTETLNPFDVAPVTEDPVPRQRRRKSKDHGSQS